MAAWVTVRRATADGCTSGARGNGLLQAPLYGAFFNGGDGTSFDDVVAYLELDHEGMAMLHDTRARSGRVLGVVRASRSSLDRRYMDDGAHELRVADLLARALAEADRE